MTSKIWTAATLFAAIATATVSDARAQRQQLMPGANYTMNVRVDPPTGKIDTTFRIQASQNIVYIDLADQVPRGKAVAVRSDKNDTKVVKLGRDGGAAKTVAEGTTSLSVVERRKVRVAIFDLEILGPNSPAGRALEPGRYEYIADIELEYGWDQDDSGRIDDDEWTKLMTADGKARFTVEGEECPDSGVCCELELAVDESVARAGDLIHLAGWLVHAGQEAVYQSLSVRLETLDGLELVGGDSEPYDIQPGEELFARETIQLPRWLLPGTYRIVVTMDRMVQGSLTRVRDIEIVD